MIAQTPDEYVKIASDLAGDLPRLAELRSTLRGRMQASPLMDGPRFARLQLSVASSVPPDVVERLTGPALRVCYVSNTIAASPPVEVTVEAGGPGSPR